MNTWIKLPDHTYKICPGVIVHEVKCPICNTHETFVGENFPNFCYVCSKTMNMPED